MSISFDAIYWRAAVKPNPIRFQTLIAILLLSLHFFGACARENRSEAPSTTPSSDPSLEVSRIQSESAASRGTVPHSELARQHNQLPVIFLSVDPKLMDFRNGVLYGMGDSVVSEDGEVIDKYPYLGSHAARKLEFEVGVEFFEPDGTLKFDQRAGMAVFGNWGSLPYPQKSLALFARKKYGTGKFKHRIFPSLPLTSYECLVLHNGGNDNQGSHQTATKRGIPILGSAKPYGSYFVNGNFTYLRDPLLQRLNSNTAVDTQASRPCVVYVNDEYWGLYTLREKLNERYLMAHYGRNKGTIDLVSGFGVANAGSASRYFEMRQFFEAGSVSRRRDILEASVEYFDIDNFIDYHLAVIYAENFDLGNVRCWRPVEADGSGRFRWILFGQDYGFGLWPESIYKPAMAKDYHSYDNMFEFCTANPPLFGGWPLGEGRTTALRRMTTNPEFRQRFVRRLTDLLNSAYREDHVEKTLQEMAAEIRPEIPRHLARWSWPELVKRGYGKPHQSEPQPLTVQLWEKHVAGLSKFARNRPTILRRDCATHFGLKSGTGTLAVAVEPADSGAIQVNSLSPKQLPWQGIVFADITNSIRVTPAAGYRFVKWTTPSGVTASTDLSYRCLAEMTNTVIARMEQVEPSSKK